MIKINRHPSALLQPQWVETIRSGAAKAEETGLLQPKQLALIYQQQWFKLLVPEVYSGTEKPLPEMVRLEESLAWADGSVGWVITLCSGAGWFGGFLPVKTASAIFKNPEACLAGSGASTGTATKIDSGFTINGTWKYASGAQHATHFTANCVVKEANETVLGEDENPLILPFIIDAKDVKLIPAWKYMGMMGTGSDAFEIKDLEVSADRSFKIDPEFTVVNHPLYRYPFLQLAEATLAANLSGMAVHFMDLCEPVFAEKLSQNKLNDTQKTVLKEALTNAVKEMQQLRNEFYQAVDQSWMLLLSDKKSMVKEALQEVSKTSRQLAKTSRETVDRLYPYCGLLAASPDTEINRVWRDLHTASQHSLLTFLE
jgi:alkylation response protein AidB-like acyl-CoA dehydrogenase